jgi:GTP cyclohydrolase I
MKDKTDFILGQKVAEQLVKLGIETPMLQFPPGVDRDPHAALLRIKAHVASIMGELGLNLEDDSLSETPKRVAKMFVNEIFSGLDYQNFPTMTVIDNKMNTDEMVLERNITMNSTCEHHLLPIIGRAHVAYIPEKKVLGLSKMNRVVKFFAQRPQVQERLVAQIHATLCHVLETEHVAVIIEAEHMCVKTRGVEDACSDTVTSKLSGAFTQASTRSELLTFIK